MVDDGLLRVNFLNNSFELFLNLKSYEIYYRKKLLILFIV